jgi:hypothetical protein
MIVRSSELDMTLRLNTIKVFGDEDEWKPNIK